MLIDGKSIARNIEEDIRRTMSDLKKPPALALVVVGSDPIIESYVRIKKRTGERLGIMVHEHRFPDTLSTEELSRAVKELAINGSADGLVIQLPLPSHIDAQKILDAVPLEKDTDMLSREAVASFARGETQVLPPVAGAIREVLSRSKVSVEGADVLIIGFGRLVGVPASILMRQAGAHVTVIDRAIADLSTHTRDASVIVCGVGKPGLIQPEMLTPGVVLIDAGASEAGGKIVGDADPRCAEVASVFTPVPGGIGPVAIAMLFQNLCMLAEHHQS